MLVIDGLAGLLSIVQAGAVELHSWGSKAAHLERPCRLIFDLEPCEDVPWRAVLEAAKEVRGRLAAMGLTSFVKTSGWKGVHVIAPIEPIAGWVAAKSFTASVAKAMAHDRPDR
jgi:bifunctional non-homologous end joining protein LigD